jgi:hypothetical protein
MCTKYPSFEVSYRPIPKIPIDSAYLATSAGGVFFTAISAASPLVCLEPFAPPMALL